MTIILLVFFLTFAEGAIIMSSSPAITPSTAGSTNTSYSFSFQNQSSISLASTSSLIVQFTSQFAINAVSNCFLSINAQPNTSSCALGGNNQIAFIGIVSSSESLKNFTVSFYTNGANYAGTMSIPVYFMDSGTNISDANGLASFSITASQMSACSVSSNSDTVGSQATWTLGFTPVVPLQTGHTLRMTLSKWGPNNISNFVNTSNIVCSRGTCSYSNQSTSEYLSASSLFTSATNDSQSLSVSTLLNPSSTYPATVLFQIMTGNNEIQNCNTQVSASKPSTMNVNFITTLNSSISFTNTNVQVNIIQSVPLPSTGFIIFKTPLSISYTPVTFSGTLPNIVSTTNGLLIGNLSQSTIGTFYTMGNFSITNPPSISPAPLTVTSMIQVNSVYYEVNSVTINITSDSSTISSSKVEFSPQNANKIAMHIVSFITVNNLISGSFITVIFPPQVTLNANSTCTSALGSCVVNAGANTANLTLNSSLVKSSNASISVTNVLNPYTTITTSSFKISTYYNSSDSLVDKLTTGLTLTSTPNALNDLNVTVGSLAVGAVTSYKFDVAFANPALPDSVINIAFPATINITNITSSICTLTSNSNTVSLSSCFSSNSSTLSVTFANVRNPTSTQPTSNFNLTLVYNGSNLQYLNKTVSVQMTTLASLAVQVEPLNTTVNANTTYKFTVTFTQVHSTGDVLKLVLPTSLITLYTPQCSPISGVASILCTYSSPNLSIALTFSTFPSNFTIQFSASTINNNWYVSTATLLGVSLSGGYEMQKGSADVSYTQGSLPVTVSNDQNIVLLDTSTISFTITPPFTISSGGLSLTISLPSNALNATSCNGTSNTQCTISNNVLTVSNLSNFQSPLIVSTTASTGYFDSTAAFTITLFYNTSLISQNNNVSVSAFCSSPCKQCLSSNKSSCLSCLPSPYTSSTFLIPSNHTCTSQCPSTTYVSVSTCLSCSSTCLNCTGASTNCTSCKTGTFLYNNNCSNTCPNGTFPSANQQCQSCDSSCKTCSSLTQCTSCPSSQYLFNSTCLTSCPDSYYSDAQKACQSCGICQLCTSATNCTSCKSPYLFVNNKCYESCPSGFPIPSDGLCLACDPSCLTCASTTKNCTSCPTSTFLFTNKCLEVCPQSMSANTLNNTCEYVQKQLVYFPGLISLGVITLLVVLSRIIFTWTSITTCLVALFACAQSVTYCYFLYLMVTGGADIVPLAMAIGSLGMLVTLSIVYMIVCIARIHRVDEYYRHWYKVYKVVSWIFNIFSFLNFKLYRLTYSRLFNLEALSACYKRSANIQFLTTGITIAGMVFVEILMVVSCISWIYLSNAKNQLYFQAIDTLIVSSIVALVAAFDIPKPNDFFSTSPFLTNKVAAFDVQENLGDQVDEVGGVAVDYHENCSRRGSQSVYKLQSGHYFDVTSQNLKLGDQSVADSLNTAVIIPIDSQTLKNLDGSNQLQRQLEKGQDVANGEIMDQLKRLDERQMEEEGNQKWQKGKRRKINIFDPIQQQTEQQLLNELQSFRSDDQYLGDGALPKRPHSQKATQGYDRKKIQDMKRLTISVFNRKELRQRWNNIIKSKVQSLKEKKEGLKPLPVTTVNQLSQTQSMKGMYRSRKLKKPKKEYHNKQLQSIYLQRIVPPTKNSRSTSAKHAFRSTKYKPSN